MKSKQNLYCSQPLTLQQGSRGSRQDLTYKAPWFRNFYSLHTKKLQMCIDVIKLGVPRSSQGLQEKEESVRLAAFSVIFIYSNNSHHFTISFSSPAPTPFFGGHNSINMKKFICMEYIPLQISR